MSGVDQSVILAVCRIRILFADEIGNEVKGHGTAFWVQDNDDSLLITNRHNLNPLDKYSDKPNLQLAECSVELRLYDDLNPQASTQYFSLDIGNHSFHSNADVAIIKNPVFPELKNEYKPISLINSNQLAKN